jgi:hypothetical protein
MLTQGMILALQEMTDALQSKRDADVEAALDLLRVLLDGTSVAFEFAGDFSPTCYRDTVRPSMEPPSTSEGFSGVLSADHRHLMKLLRTLKPQLDKARSCFPSHYERFMKAFGEMYDSHKHVCSRFAGNEEPSLLMSGKNDRTASQQLEQFKQMRMKSIA